MNPSLAPICKKVRGAFFLEYLSKNSEREFFGGRYKYL
jgi:hypothetical protein